MKYKVVLNLGNSSHPIKNNSIPNNNIDDEYILDSGRAINESKEDDTIGNKVKFNENKIVISYCYNLNIVISLFENAK